MVKYLTVITRNAERAFIQGLLNKNDHDGLVFNVQCKILHAYQNMEKE